jgi:hypothetical protein
VDIDKFIWTERGPRRANSVLKKYNTVERRLKKFTVVVLVQGQTLMRDNCFDKGVKQFNRGGEAFSTIVL